jgi:hypothetical protein
MLARLAALLLVAIATPAFAQARFEIYPEPEIRQSATNRVNSAYVVDKKENRFWICTARYAYAPGSNQPNSGECNSLGPEIGRPSLTERYVGAAITGSTPYGPFLPVLWFVEPSTGDVQFCAVRHAGLCLKLSLPGVP